MIGLLGQSFLLDEAFNYFETPSAILFLVTKLKRTSVSVCFSALGVCATVTLCDLLQKIAWQIISPFGEKIRFSEFS